MRAPRLGVLGVVAWLCLRAQAAAACGATPAPWYTVDRHSPQGEAVPLNAPIVVQLLETTGDSDAPQAAHELSLRVEGTDEVLSLPVLGAVGGATKLSFVPEHGLEPNTTYHATFRVGQVSEGTPPVEPSSASWTFTTTDAAAPALQLAGQLEVTLEPGQDPIFVCSNPCGGDCTQSGWRSVTHARVKIPELSGGFGSKLSARLLLTNDSPGSFAPPSKTTPATEHDISVELLAELTAGTGGELRLTLPLAVQPYRPCFALKVSDDRGDEVFAEPVCLDEAFPSSRPPLGDGGSASGGSAAAGSYPVLVDDTPRSESSGCSVDGHERGSTSALALLLGLAVLNRRRKPKTAP